MAPSVPKGPDSPRIKAKAASVTQARGERACLYISRSAKRIGVLSAMAFSLSAYPRWKGARGCLKALGNQTKE